MSTAAQTDPAGDRQWKAQLGRAASRRARAEAEFYAAVAEVDARVPQTEIAAVLHTTQDTVSRWAARGREQTTQVPPGQLAGSAYEVAQRYAAGEITREQMLDALIGWPYEPEEPLPLDEWNITPVPAGPGSFEETTGRAYDDGLLTRTDYDAILDGLSEQESGPPA